MAGECTEPDLKYSFDLADDAGVGWVRLKEVAPFYEDMVSKWKNIVWQRAWRFWCCHRGTYPMSSQTNAGEKQKQENNNILHEYVEGGGIKIHYIIKLVVH